MKTFKFIIFIWSGLFISCTDFIEVNPPNDQLLTPIVFASDQTATAALLGLYIRMVDNNIPYDIPMASGLLSDELDSYANQSPLLDLYVNNSRPLDAYTNSFWNAAYFYTYQANSVIEGCSNSKELDPTLKLQLLGEAHFMRAFWLYYLTNFFGDIPLTLTTNYKTNQNLSRSPVEEVYSQITDDLMYAIENLNSQYVDNTSKSITNERIRPNKAAAIAMLARVKLSMKNWNEAERFAGMVIENSQLYEIVDLNDIFLKDSREAIWQLMEPTPRAVDFSTREGNGFILISRPSIGGQLRNSSISQWLLNAFSSEDLRGRSWIGEYIDETVEPNQSFYYPNKYKINKTTTEITEQSTVLRLAEQYLIRAEARIQTGDFEGGREDLNVIRKRAGLSPIVLDAKEELLNAVLDERQIELFAEWGHRWIDIRRMGYAEEVMSDVIPVKGGEGWDRTKELMPIPQTEIDRNNNLIQNPGYN